MRVKGSILPDGNMIATAVAVFLVCVNVLSFAAFGIDKARAQRGAWRIPEKVLMLLAVLGGSVGAFVGMRVFRHKTRKAMFRIGIPALLAAELLAAALVGSIVLQVPHVEDFQVATVDYVVDGDTVDVSLDGSTQRVRLIGIDAPESVNHDESVNSEEGEAASDFLKSLLEPGMTVYLQADQEDRDRYDRLLRYLWLEAPSDPRDPEEVAGKMANAIMVANGYADTMRYEPNTYYAEQFEALKEQAAAEDAGISWLFS